MGLFKKKELTVKTIQDIFLDNRYSHYLKNRSYPNAIYMNNKCFKEIFSLGITIELCYASILICFDDNLRDIDMFSCTLSEDSIINEMINTEQILKELISGLR